MQRRGVCWLHKEQQKNGSGQPKGNVERQQGAERFYPGGQDSKKWKHRLYAENFSKQSADLQKKQQAEFSRRRLGLTWCQRRLISVVIEFIQSPESPSPPQVNAHQYHHGYRRRFFQNTGHSLLPCRHTDH